MGKDIRMAETSTDLIVKQILAEAEMHRRKQISIRTKAALQASKRRGVLLGSNRPGHWNGREDRRRVGLKKAVVAAAKSHRDAAKEAYKDIVQMCHTLRDEGYSNQQIADALNRDGLTTRLGRPWHRIQVFRVLQRYT